MPSEDPRGFTVFISYAHGDNENSDPAKRWLNRLLEQLQPLVLQNRVSAWSDRQIEAGEQWDKSIKAQLEETKAAVLLVSPAFLASKYIRNSELPVLLMNAMSKGGIVIPVILRPSLFVETTFKYPDPARGPGELSLSVFQSANPPDKPLNAIPEHEQDAVLLSVAQRILALSRAKASTGSAAAVGLVWAVPLPRNPFFTGRTEVLDELHQKLAAGGKAALSGMGGIGKTQTAVEYAYRRRGEYKAVLWAKADTEDSLKADFAAIAAKLDLPEKGETDRDVVIAAVKRWLEENADWLLILDNADDLEIASDLLRREWGGHILLTTRAYATGSVSRVEIREMTAEEGTLFLLRRAKLIEVEGALESAGEAEQALAAEITREVGGLPLALDQAGAFIEGMQSSLAEYLELYLREGAALRAARGGVISDHEPVTITFSLAFRQMEAESAAAADMLRVCAFLAPDAIPEEIFSEGAAELGENLARVAGGGINLVKVIGEAGKFSLIRRNVRSGTIEIHRLVQQVIKDEMRPEERRVWAERVVRGVNSAFPEIEHKNWPLCEKLLPHGQEAARLIDDYELESDEAARLLNQVGYYCVERAQYAGAEQLFARSLAIRERSLGPDHPDVATGLNNLASLYDSLGRYAEAEPLYMRSLAIREKSLGPDHPRLALSLNNLAYLYNRQGRYVESEPLLARALSINEKALGPDHPSVATGLNNLASLYDSLGRYAEAEPLFARALSIDEKALGPDHPDVATDFNNLASLYENQGRYEEAEQLSARSLAIREKSLGPDHPDVAVSLNNLASLYNKQGRYAEAEPLYVRALGIFKKVLEPDHPDVAVSLNNLASLYNRQGRYAEAEPLYLRSLAIRERVFGPDHPSVGTGLNNLATFYAAQGKLSEAEPLLARAKSIFERVLGPDHPRTSMAQESYTELSRRIRNEPG
ncbi:MAG: FxSxx-COOH system tetratricopeptide repeat protein [Acidobacteriota bacterium]|nr:FxSxx-COOH system tetratricopeptide repeat protein [Acidobacteriota bacterium]